MLYREDSLKSISFSFSILSLFFVLDWVNLKTLRMNGRVELQYSLVVALEEVNCKFQVIVTFPYGLSITSHSYHMLSIFYIVNDTPI